jgi:hypothetical protein
METAFENYRNWRLAVTDSKVAWRSYEDVARHVLTELRAHLGLSRVEGSQSLPGFFSGATWRVDGRAVREGSEAIVLIECRRHTTERLKQEQLAAIAFRILDTGSVGGIVVTPIGLQEGAERVARCAGVVCMQLGQDDDFDNWVAAFLGRVFIKSTISMGAAIDFAGVQTTREGEVK